VVLAQLAKYFEEKGAIDKVDEMRKEWTLLNRCGLMPADSFPDVWRWCIDNIGRPYPESKQGDVDYYKKRLAETSNSLHKARYAYAIWVLTKKDVSYAKQSVEYFLDSAAQRGKAELDASSIETTKACFEISFKLAISMNMKSPLGANDVFMRFFTTFQAQRSMGAEKFVFGSLTDLMIRLGTDLMTRKEYKVDKGARAAISEVAKIAGEMAKEFSSIGNYEIEQQYLNREASLFSILGSEEDAKKAKIGVAESILKRADSTKADSLLTSIWLESAAKLYSELGMPDKVRELGARIEQGSSEAAKKFKTITTSVEIPADEIVGMYLQKISGMTPEKILSQIVADDSEFIPDLQATRKLEEQLSKEHPLSYILPHKEYDESIPAKTITNEDEILESAVNRTFLLDARLRLSILSLILSKIIPQSIQKDHILNFLKSTKNISSEDLEIISRGLDYYFSGDYLGFCHVIMPRIEQELRSILKASRGTTLSYDPKDIGFDQKVMGGLVRDLESSLDANLHKYVEVWLTQEGVNLRNKISHGWLKLIAFDKATADLTLYLLLRLADV